MAIICCRGKKYCWEGWSLQYKNLKVAFEDIPNIKVIDISFAQQRTIKKDLEKNDAFLFSQGMIERIKVIEE